MKNPDYPAPPPPAHVNKVRHLKARIAELEEIVEQRNEMCSDYYTDNSRLRGAILDALSYARMAESAQDWKRTLRCVRLVVRTLMEVRDE